MSEAAARGLREEINAFVGPTYARVEGLAADLDSTDAQESALQALQDGRVFRIHVAESKAAAAVNRQLTLLQRAWSRRPPELGLTQRSTSQVLRDLDSAMQGGQLRRARDVIDELHAGGRLSGVNLECLEIWWSAAQERWADIIIRPGVDDLVALRLPRHATAALIDAAYHVHVEPHEQLDPPQLAELFAERILPRFGRLFRNSEWSTTTTGRKAWLLFAASTTPPSEAIRDAVLGAAADAERETLRALAEALEERPIAPPAPDVAGAVAAMLESGDYRGAWESVVLQDDADGAWRARVLLHCAYETVDPEWAAAALRALDHARLLDPERVSGRTVVEQETELRRLVTPGEVPVADWYDWLATLAVSEAPRDVVALARDRSEMWNADSLLERDDSGDLVLDVLTSAADRAEALREARPLLVPAVLDSPVKRPELAGPASRFLRLLSDGIVGDERLGYGDLDDLAAVAEFVIGGGIAADEYRAFVLGTLEAAWQRAASVRSLGWLMDIAELLNDSPCPDNDVRVSFTSAVISALTRYRAQIPPEHWDRAEEVFESLGRRDEIESLRPGAEKREAALLEWAGLKGRRIFVYTLVEPAGDRARRYFEDVAPGVVVDLWAASVADDRMLHAVRGAELVVVATRAAKHAATLAIERAVPADVPVTYPTGKGWSSIVTAVRDSLPLLTAGQ